LPIIVVVAHYDSFAAAPSLAFGGDSNASGAVALIQLARLFSKLMQTTRLQSKYDSLTLTGSIHLVHHAH
jgi:Zn-dependent M28 family amino/carboxypeptidase